MPTYYQNQIKDGVKFKVWRYVDDTTPTKQYSCILDDMITKAWSTVVLQGGANTQRGWGVSAFIDAGTGHTREIFAVPFIVGVGYNIQLNFDYNPLSSDSRGIAGWSKTINIPHYKEIFTKNAEGIAVDYRHNVSFQGRTA